MKQIISINQISSILLSTLVALSAAGCGGKSRSSGGGGGHGPDDSSDLSYVVDKNALQKTDQTIAEVTGATPAWTVRASQSGKELAKVEKGTITDVIGALDKLKFKPKEVALFELTIAAKGEDHRILATNLKDAAQTSDLAKTIWDKDCEGKIKPDVTFGDAASASDYMGKGEISVKLSVCDIEGAIAQPGVAIIAQPKFYEIKTAAFKCTKTASDSDYDFIYFVGAKDCTPGYDFLVGESSREFHLPKGYDPSKQGSKQFNLSTFDIDSKNGYASLINLDYSKPFAMTCHEVRVDLFRKSPSTGELEFAPMTWKASESGWNQLGTKTPASEESLYAAANKRAERTAYFLCDWANEVKDGTTLIPTSSRQ